MFGRTRSDVAMAKSCCVASSHAFLGHVFNPSALAESTTKAARCACDRARCLNRSAPTVILLCHKTTWPIRLRLELARKRYSTSSPFHTPIEGVSIPSRLRPLGRRILCLITYKRERYVFWSTLTAQNAPDDEPVRSDLAVRARFGSRRVLELIHWQALRSCGESARLTTRGALSHPTHDVHDDDARASPAKPYALFCRDALRPRLACRSIPRAQVLRAKRTGSALRPLGRAVRLRFTRRCARSGFGWLGPIYKVEPRIDRCWCSRVLALSMFGA